MREHLIFGYFFHPIEQDKPFLPQRIESTLYYASLSEDEFERQFVSSMASTAIDYQQNAAAEGQLHEVELMTIDLRRDTSLVCHSERNEESLVWLTRFLVSLGMTEERLSALSRFKWVAEFIMPRTECGKNMFLVGYLLARKGERIKCDSTEVKVDGYSLFSQVLAQVQIGGERRYGFGQLRFGHRFKTSNELLIIRNVRDSGFGIRDYEFRLK